MKTPQVSINAISKEVCVDLDTLDEEERQDLRSCLHSLIKSSGWSTLRGVVNSQVQLKNMSLLQPLPNRDALLAAEHLKGCVYGAIEVLDLPQILLDQLNEEEED